MRRSLIPVVLAFAVCQSALAGKIPTIDAGKTDKASQLLSVKKKGNLDLRL
jgi:hypothetical protein